eukprot:SAG25_NODE_3635_length_1016_cov_1.058888_1_plen_141_part_00
MLPLAGAVCGQEQRQSPFPSSTPYIYLSEATVCMAPAPGRIARCRATPGEAAARPRLLVQERADAAEPPSVVHADTVTAVAVILERSRGSGLLEGRRRESLLAFLRNNAVEGGQLGRNGPIGTARGRQTLTLSFLCRRWP